MWVCRSEIEEVREIEAAEMPSKTATLWTGPHGREYWPLGAENSTKLAASKKLQRTEFYQPPVNLGKGPTSQMRAQFHLKPWLSLGRPWAEDPAKACQIPGPWKWWDNKWAEMAHESCPTVAKNARPLHRWSNQSLDVGHSWRTQSWARWLIAAETFHDRDDNWQLPTNSTHRSLYDRPALKMPLQVHYDPAPSK